MNNKLSDQIEEFFSENMINLMNDFVSNEKNKTSYRIDKLPIDQYFPIKHNLNYNDLKIDDIGKYSITLPRKADAITKLILTYIKSTSIAEHVTITDATAGVGGNVLSFCKYGINVNAVELDTERFEYLKHNVSKYEYNVNLYNNNYLDIYETIKQDIIFIDPPWGGPEYKKSDEIILSLNDISLEDICNNIFIKKLAKLTVLKLPYNYNLNHMKNKILCPFNIYNLKNILMIFIFNFN
jgi:predicted RNA methylase